MRRAEADRLALSSLSASACAADGRGRRLGERRGRRGGAAVRRAAWRRRRRAGAARPAAGRARRPRTAPEQAVQEHRAIVPERLSALLAAGSGKASRPRRRRAATRAFIIALHARPPRRGLYPPGQRARAVRRIRPQHHQAPRRRDAAGPGTPFCRTAADPAELLEPDQEPLAADRRAPGAPVRAVLPEAGRLDGRRARRGHGRRASRPRRRRRPTARCRRTTTSASSRAWCSPTTAAIRSAPARACSTCWARC